MSFPYYYEENFSLFLHGGNFSNRNFFNKASASLPRLPSRTSIKSVDNISDKVLALDESTEFIKGLLRNNVDNISADIFISKFVKEDRREQNSSDKSREEQNSSDKSREEQNSSELSELSTKSEICEISTKSEIYENKFDNINRPKPPKLTRYERLKRKSTKLTPSNFHDSCICGHNIEYRELLVYTRKSHNCKNKITIYPKVPAINIKLR